MADSARRAADKKLQEMEEHIAELYKQAQIEVQSAADQFFSDFARLDAEKQKLVEKGAWTEKEYEDWRVNKILYSKKFQHQQEQIAENLLHTNEIATAYVNGEVPEVFALGFNRFAKDVESIGGLSFSLVDADTVRLLATSDKSLLPYKKLDPAKDVAWNMKKVNSEVLNGILVGESIPKIAKRMQNVTGSNEAAAIRTARTAVTGAENSGRLESYKRGVSNGIRMKKKWLSSDQPGRTRDWHLSSSFGSLEVDVDEPFSNGLGLIMYPGDPGAHPANVYNCRCSMKSVIKGFDKISNIPEQEIEQYRQTNPFSFTLAKSSQELGKEDYFQMWTPEDVSDTEMEKIKTCKPCRHFIETGGLCKLKGKATGKCLYFESKEQTNGD